VDIYWTWKAKEPELDEGLGLDTGKRLPIWEPYIENNSSIQGPINVSNWMKC